MKVQTFINVVDNRYRVEIRIYDTTQNEDELMEQYGEPLIEVGSTDAEPNFVGTETVSEAGRGVGGDVSVSFTMPAEQRRLKSDFPLVKYFDLADDVDSDVKAKVYADKILSRITTAKTTLLTNVSDFEGETVTTF